MTIGQVWTSSSLVGLNICKRFKLKFDTKIENVSPHLIFVFNFEKLLPDLLAAAELNTSCITRILWSFFHNNLTLYLFLHKLLSYTLRKVFLWTESGTDYNNMSLQQEQG